jgi:hypothetical protein
MKEQFEFLRLMPEANFIVSSPGIANRIDSFGVCALPRQLRRTCRFGVAQLFRRCTTASNAQRQLQSAEEYSGSVLARYSQGQFPLSHLQYKIAIHQSICSHKLAGHGVVTPARPEWVGASLLVSGNNISEALLPIICQRTLLKFRKQARCMSRRTGVTNQDQGTIDNRVPHDREVLTRAIP